MSEQLVRMRIQLRRDTTANWELYKDVVPAAGEPCFDLDLGTLKIGNGVKTYEQLDAIGGAGDVAVSADGTSIILSDGVFQLAGFDAAETGAQPRKKSDGTLEWIVPSTDTVEGLQVTVAGLQSDVTELQTKMDGTGEGSINAKIDAKINEFASRVTDDGTVNTIAELVNYVANHGGEAATMAADIASLQGLVGDESVAGQIAAAVSGIETGDVNVIESVSVGGTLLDIVEKGVNVPVAGTVLGVVKASDEVTVAADGTLGIGQVSISKLVQEDGLTLVLDGGNAS